MNERKQITNAETRFIFGQLASIELREQDTKPVITGYAAVFYDGMENTEYQLWDGAKERIMPGAFDDAVKNDDVRALFNHDVNFVLGRNKSGTLTLQIDERGLKYIIDPPDTQQARDIIEVIKRGDVSGSSFSFMPSSQQWITEDDMDIRVISKVKLYDVGPVTFPAYEATTSGFELAKRSLEEAKQKRGMKLAIARARLRMEELMIDD